MSVQLVLLESAIAFAMAGGVLALSTYVVMWTGQLSFATAAFAALGGFTATWLWNETEVGLVAGIAIATAISGIAGLIVGRLFLNLSSHWLALATVALVLIARVFVVNLGDATGGPAGVVVPETLDLWQLLVLLVIVCAVLASLAKSKFGVAASTSREDPSVAAALGVPVNRIRVIAFGLSGLLGGLGGVMLATQLRFIGPDTYHIDLAVTIIASVVLGGAYHWFGSVIGAAVFTGLPVYITQFISEGQEIINGMLLLAIIIWLPGGLIDPVRWRRYRESRRIKQRNSSELTESPVEPPNSSPRDTTHA